MHKFKGISFVLIFIFTILFIYRNAIIEATKISLLIPPDQYIGVTVDVSQILPESEHYVVNDEGKDLIDISAELGINTFRLTNIRSISEDRDNSIYTHEQWENMFNKMREKNIYAVVLIEANNTDTEFHDSKLDEYYIQFVKDYLITPDVCNFPNVVAVSIRNEPLINADNLNVLRESSQLVKSACPNALITIGSWKEDNGKKQDNGEIEYDWYNPAVAVKIDDIVDIHSIHMYGFDKTNEEGNYPDAYNLTLSYIAEMRKYTDKPILIEEFGAGNGQATTDQNTRGSIVLQKHAYEDVLRLTRDQKDNKLIGALAYLMLPRLEGKESWNIAMDDANILLPAAYTFKEN